MLINICAACGQYRADKIIEPGEGDAGGGRANRDSPAYAVCPECGYRHPFLRLPLLLVGGASGSGKTAALQHLVQHWRQHFGDAMNAPPTILLESDILWQPAFDQPETDYRTYFETWLRICKNINQSGQPVALFGAGFAVPSNIEPCVERRYFAAVKYLGFVCDDDVLAARLRARPAWRSSAAEDHIRSQQKFNAWIKTQAAEATPDYATIDTTSASVSQIATQTAAWIVAALGKAF